MYIVRYFFVLQLRINPNFHSKQTYSLNTVVFCSMWWLKRKAWRTQTFVSYKILLKIRWKVQWRLHKQFSKTSQMHREKGKSKALAYTNWHIGSLRMYFAYRECSKLFTYLETKASAKTVKKKRHGHKVLNFSVCAKKCGLRPEQIFESIFVETSHDPGIFSNQDQGKPRNLCRNMLQAFCNSALLSTNMHI